jgi:hypothetical protein
MKALIFLALVCLFYKARAEPIAVMEESVGKVVLMSDVCEFQGVRYPALRQMYFVLNNMTVAEGCYHLNGNTVVAKWVVGIEKKYPAKYFYVIEKGKTT